MTYVPSYIKDKPGFRLYHKRLDAGLCPRCGGKRDGEWIYCNSCLEKSTSRTYDTKRKTASKRRSRRRNKRLGLCVDCGQPAAEGITRCQYHREKKREQDKAYNVKKILKILAATT